MGRITNFCNWSPAMLYGKNTFVLALEYWSYDEDALWKMDNNSLATLAKKELVKTGLVKSGEILNTHIGRVHRSYPVYDMAYKDKIQTLQQAADKIGNLAFIGRGGAFKYNSQDHSILMGLLATENILAGQKKHDLWQVNTGYDYQEGGKSMDSKDKGET